MRRAIFQLLVLVSASWVGCSSDRVVGNDDSLDFGTADGGTPDSGCAGLSCSRDLRSIRDCSGAVVKQCPANQACGNGECVEPCSAAAANQGSVGCAFSVPTPNTEQVGRGSCHAFFVANNWTSPATIHLALKGEEMSLDGSVFVPSVADGVVTHTKLDGPIPPGGGAVIFVSNTSTGAAGAWTACPPGTKPIFAGDPSLNETGIGHATTVTTDVPVSMYSIYPYGGAASYNPSAMLLFPSTSFRNSYVLTSAWGGKSDGFGRDTLPGRSANQIQRGNPTIQIVATEDDTSIDFRPKVDLVGGNGIQPIRRGEVGTYTLKRGEVLELIQTNELAGSVINSSKPVGVFGGHTCMDIPSDVGACDLDNEQIPPVEAWGHEYAVLPAPNRIQWASRGKASGRDPSPIRILGAVDGTTLVYEPTQPPGAPSTLASTQLAVFFADEPFVVRSQDSAHPFHVTTVMTGAASVPGVQLGDPEVSMVVPTDQWLDSYGFFTDYTYTLSGVFVTRRRVNGAFSEVTLDCAGPLTGWKSITADFEWTYAELTRNLQPEVYPAGKCTDGAHQIHSDGPFTMTAWGLAWYASYGYPGGAGLRPVTDAKVSVH